MVIQCYAFRHLPEGMGAMPSLESVKIRVHENSPFSGFPSDLPMAVVDFAGKDLS